MRSLRPHQLSLACLALACAPLAAQAQTVTAGPAFDVSVTVYRDPDRDEGGFDLDYLAASRLSRNRAASCSSRANRRCALRA